MLWPPWDVYLVRTRHSTGAFNELPVTITCPLLSEGSSRSISRLALSTEEAILF